MFKIEIVKNKQQKLSPTRVAIAKVNNATQSPIAISTIGSNAIVLNAAELGDLLTALESNRAELHSFLQQSIGMGYTLKVSSAKEE